MRVKPAFNDYVSLCLAIIAKRRRKPLSSNNHCDDREFYEDFFIDKDIAERELDARRNIRRKTIQNYVNEHVAPKANILDVGCGFGEALSCFGEHYQLHGMDYSHSNIQVARKLLNHNTILRQGSIYDIPFDSESQDVCLCLEVLEHIEDDSKGVRDIFRVLKPGGILIASVPHTYYWSHYLELIGHYRHYTRETFEALLRKSGFAVIDYLPNYPNWHHAYSRAYCWVRFLSILFGKITRKKGTFDFKFPWQQEALLSAKEIKLEPLLEKDAAIPYSSSNTSTFLAAKKLPEIQSK